MGGSYAVDRCLDFNQRIRAMSLDADAKKVLLRKIPHGLFICGVRNGDEVNGFTASWVTQGSFEPPLVVMGVRADSSSHAIIEATSSHSTPPTASVSRGRPSSPSSKGAASKRPPSAFWGLKNTAARSF